MANEPVSLRKQTNENAGSGMLGGTFGLLTPLLGLIGVGTLLNGPPVVFNSPWPTVVVSLGLFFGCALIAGTLFGCAGVCVALWLRRRRHASWPERRAAFVGAYIAGNLGAFTCCLPMTVA